MTDYHLVIGAKVELHAVAEKKFKPLSVEFNSGKARHRRLNPGQELLAKAIGWRHDQAPSVIDATAGLGRDAFLLASFGCQVTLLERQTLIYSLLADGIKRAQADPEIKAIATRMQLYHADAHQQLANLSADVVYLDPMYPHRTKSALVKKDMQILQEIVGADTDAEGLFAQAHQAAKKRIVIKRPKGAKDFTEQAPDFRYNGKSTRFDVYIIKTNNKEQHS